MIDRIMFVNKSVNVQEKGNDYNANDQTKRRYIRDFYAKKGWGRLKKLVFPEKNTKNL